MLTLEDASECRRDIRKRWLKQHRPTCRWFGYLSFAKTLATLSKAGVGFAGGAFVATGDVTGDGTADVIVSRSDGSRPYVPVFNGKKLVGKNPKASLVSRIRTASDNGVRIASYDVNGDGFDDVVTSATVGTSSIVKIFSGADGSVLDTLENDQAGRVFVA